MSGPERSTDDQADHRSYREIAAEALRGQRPSGLAVARTIDDVFTPTASERARAETPAPSGGRRVPE